MPRPPRSRASHRKRNRKRSGAVPTGRGRYYHARRKSERRRDRRRRGKLE